MNTTSKEYRSVWESVEEMLADCDTPYQAGRTHGFSRSSFIGREFDSWNDIKTAAGAEWPEGLAEITSMAEELAATCEAPLPKSRRRTPRWAEDGDEFD